MTAIDQQRGWSRNMWAYNVNWFITKIISIPVAAVGIVTTLFGGLILAFPVVGLLFLLAFQLVWLPILGVVLGTGWIWHKAPPGIRSLVVPVGLPFAILGNIALTLMPAGGDPNDMWGKRVKQVLCQGWPWATTLDDRYLVDLWQEQNAVGFSRALFEFCDADLRRQLGLTQGLNVPFGVRSADIPLSNAPLGRAMETSVSEPRSEAVAARDDGELSAQQIAITIVAATALALLIVGAVAFLFPR